MIAALGKKRLTHLIVVASIAAALGAALFGYVQPLALDQSRTLQGLRGQYAGKVQETEQLRTEFEQIKAQKENYDSLEAIGFMRDQSRTVAQRSIDDIQKFSRIISATYDIEPATIIQNQNAQQANYVVIDSPMTFTVNALDDTDIYKFVYWMQNAFPGQVSIRELSVLRQLDINEATLRQIGTDNNTAMVKATLMMHWQTMMPIEKAQAMMQSGDMPQ